MFLYRLCDINWNKIYKPGFLTDDITMITFIGLVGECKEVKAI